MRSLSCRRTTSAARSSLDAVPTSMPPLPSFKRSRRRASGSPNRDRPPPPPFGRREFGFAVVSSARIWFSSSTLSANAAKSISGSDCVRAGAALALPPTPPLPRSTPPPLIRGQRFSTAAALGLSFGSIDMSSLAKPACFGKRETASSRKLDAFASAMTVRRSLSVASYPSGVIISTSTTPREYMSTAVV
eukprot:31158-Pelagococcus_subviridis.AAC.4